MSQGVIFQDKDRIYTADTCEPLKAAVKRNEVFLRGWARGNYPGTPMPENILPEVRSIGVWDATRPQSWGLDLHCNEGIEFTYIARGKTAFEVDGKTWMLRTGDFTITRPWQFHRLGNPNIGASRLIWLILDVKVRRPNQSWQWPEWLVCSPQDLKQLTNLLRHNEQPVWQADEELARCFGNLDKLLAERTPRSSETKLVLTINQLIVAVLDILQHKQIPLDEHLSTTQRVVGMFLTELPKHIAYNWSLAEMAAQCGLSRSQFSMYCKQITNMSPVDYLNYCRIEEAARLLETAPDTSITEIAFSCGFNSSQYFATAFQSRKGCTPSEFRLSRLAVQEKT
jgi:AraC family L-rhamnose operon regulatory protein RhaS